MIVSGSDIGTPVQVTRLLHLRHIRFAVIGLFSIAAIYLLAFGEDFAVPIAFAFFIALTFRPAVRRLARNGVPPWVSTIAIILGSLTALLSAIYFLAGPLTGWISQIPNYTQQFVGRVAEWRSSFRFLLILSDRLQELTEFGPSPPLAKVVVEQSGLYSYLSQVSGYSAKILANIVLSALIAAYLMASGDLFYAKLVKILPTLSDKKAALRVLYDVEREVSGYLLIVTAINAALGATVGIAFYALGMPAPLLWASIVFALNYIPYIGTAAGIAFSGFMSIILFDSLTYAILPPLAYACLNGIENQFITPIFLGRRLKLNAVAIMIALVFWTWLWGIPGTMLAVPFLLTFKVLCDHLESLKNLGEFLSEGRPAPNSTITAEVEERAQSRRNPDEPVAF